jgi:hypothetical protein
MMSLPLEKKTPVEELLSVDEPSALYSTFSEFASAWLCSDSCNGTTAEQRTTMLLHHKALRLFLYRLQKERRKNKKTKMNMEVWIS